MLTCWCLCSVPSDLTPEECQELENIRRRKQELLADIQVRCQGPTQIPLSQGQQSGCGAQCPCLCHWQGPWSPIQGPSCCCPTALPPRGSGDRVPAGM